MKTGTLEDFFNTQPRVDLNNCDTEAIHRSGAVQRGAVLFAFDLSEGKLVAWSGNAAEFGFDLPQPGGGAAAITYESLFPDLAQEIREHISDTETRFQHNALSDVVQSGGEEFDAILCVTAEVVFLELLPSFEMSPRVLKSKLRRANAACGAIAQAPDFDAATRLAVEAVKELTDFDRVKIYRFLPDGSGAVIAEAKDADMPSYLGLHFPESDIPKQARHLYAMLPFRAVFSTDDDISPILSDAGLVADTLDLTWSMGRSISTMHTAYLRNMGVSASFSVSLMDGADLWGLIACHSRTKINVGFDIWCLVRDIANALMVKSSQVRDGALVSKIRQMRDLEADVALELRQRGAVEDVLMTYASTLKDFLDAEGFAFQFDGEVHAVGKTPDKTFIRRLLRWVGERESEQDYYHTKALHREWPDAQGYIETACGVLVQPVIIHRVCQLVWFRGPVTKTVKWAGNPERKLAAPGEDQAPVLTPRASFEAWVEQHRDEAVDWTHAEIGAAREIFKEVLDIIASQAQILKRMTSELQLSQEETREELSQFAYAAAHDIQNPINTITSALDLIRSSAMDSDDPVLQKSMEFAERSSERLRHLADQMADFVALGRREITPEPVPLETVLADVTDMLAQLLKESGAELSVDPLPEIQGRQDLLVILFLNLISNAVKYSKPDQRPKISVTCKRRGNLVSIAVSDNGIGIPAEHAERIFKPFDRLHRSDTISGSGLGLATCQRIAELHKTTILLDRDYTDGARLIFDLHTEPWVA